MKNQQRGWGLCAALALLLLPATTAWGYFFDDRREMSLSGFAYSRATFATADGVAGQKRTYYAGNLVQHRNFLTLEWRHNLNRVSRAFPTVGEAFRFLNIDAFDYYLNMRTEYDGVFDYGPMKIRRILRGERRHVPYFDDRNTPTPFDGSYFTPGGGPNFPANTLSLSNRRWAREQRGANVRLFEWYFNLTKGPLFIRLGRQNLSWGEADAFRLLDQINPLDNTYGGFLIELDERRIPLNMLRAQWSFGTVGPIGDLTLEGFYSIDNEAPPVFPTSSVNFWASPQTGNTATMVGRTPCGGNFMATRGIPAYAEDLLFPYKGSGSGPNHGGGCSNRGAFPHSNLSEGRGGGRILGTIHDFTFSIAHYYTYQDVVVARLDLISPTRDHLRWDVGLPTDSQGRSWPQGNPWGPEDPVASRMISSGRNPAGRGGIATVAGGERNAPFSAVFERIQVTGASLSFPVNALTGMFVGSDNPLYYVYTTLRSEVAFFNNVPTNRGFAHADGSTAFDRFLGGSLGVAGGAFRPGGVLAHEAGRRAAHTVKRDYLAWVLGLDHNQWIRFLNPSNTFFISAQQFWLNKNGQDTSRDPSRPPSVLNDRDIFAGRVRSQQRIGGRQDGSTVWRAQGNDWLTTLAINTQYMAGNVRPAFVFFYDWSGPYLIQPRIDWVFWDPFRASIRYNFIEGRGNKSLGIANQKDNVWIQLEYLLY